MKVDIGDFRLVNDKRQYAIQIKKIWGDNSEKRAGEIYYESISYYTSIVRACERIIDLSIMESDSKTLSDIVDVVNHTKNLISESLGIKCERG